MIIKVSDFVSDVDGAVMVASATGKYNLQTSISIVGYVVIRKQATYSVSFLVSLDHYLFLIKSLSCCCSSSPLSI